jgi:hypothetical protein
VFATPLYQLETPRVLTIRLKSPELHGYALVAMEPHPSRKAGSCVMSTQFWPCPGCSRHVKRGDAICPFCGATALVEFGPTRVLAGRLSRAAIFAGAMGTAVASTDCGTPPSFSAFYGAISPPQEFEGSGASDAGPGLVVTDAYLSPTETNDSSATEASSDAAGDAADASATTGPTDSSSAADVAMAVPFDGAAAFPDE